PQEKARAKGCSSTIWATSGDRRSKGFPSTASVGEQAISGRPVLAATMSVISESWRSTLPHYRPQQLHPRHQLRSLHRAKFRRSKPQQPRSQTRLSNLLPPSLRTRVSMRGVRRLKFKRPRHRKQTKSPPYSLGLKRT